MFKTLSVLLLAVGLVAGRDINGEGMALIKSFEGFYANFYNDPTGIKTIGYGHACHVNDCSKITPPISEAQGEQILRDDLVTHQNCVQNQVSFVNDNQFAAVSQAPGWPSMARLVSFSFNLGCGALEGSTLLKYVKEKNYQGAAGEFGKWVHGGGRVLPGLVRRRAAERDLFLK